jgi:hypothetical protein
MGEEATLALMLNFISEGLNLLFQTVSSIMILKNGTFDHVEKKWTDCYKIDTVSGQGADVQMFIQISNFC